MRASSSFDHDVFDHDQTRQPSDLAELLQKIDEWPEGRGAGPRVEAEARPCAREVLARRARPGEISSDRRQVFNPHLSDVAGVDRAPIRPVRCSFPRIEIVGVEALPRRSEPRARHAAAGEELKFLNLI